jgi:seryl-tRNA synthetase
VWRSAPGGPYADPLPALLDAGTAYFAGEGQVGLGEPILSLMDDLDARLRAVAMDTVGTAKAVEYRYPTLLPTSALERFGYFGSFPQYVMFVTRLHSDADVYDAFLSAYADRGRLGPELFAYCRSNEYCLPPTMCYHTYHHYRDRRLPCDTMVTATGKAFRFESRYRSGLERLWDFTIRELVFLGGAEFVADRRDRVMRAAIGLVEELGLTGRCELAHDHFFGTGTVAEKILSQRMMHLKYELILDTAEGRSVAVGSFNLHGQFFGESFGIDGPDGSPVASACVGFGLERLAAAFLCQHGTDPAAWPRLRSGRPG